MPNDPKFPDPEEYCGEHTPMDPQQVVEQAESARAAEAALCREDFTCCGCPDQLFCDYSWDPYNTNGDCLASK